MKVLVAGDFCQRFRVNEKIEQKEFGSMFDTIKPIISACDIKVVNFEFPIVTETGKTIKKIGPTLKGSEFAVEAVKYAGFNFCTLANNHILDQAKHVVLKPRICLKKVVYSLLV